MGEELEEEFVVVGPHGAHTHIRAMKIPTILHRDRNKPSLLSEVLLIRLTLQPEFG